MDAIPSQPRIVKFGVFEVDLRNGEIRKAGIRQKLPGQPFRVLQALLEHPQKIVTREELRQRLWPDNTFVDYELALKKAVNRLREVLGDSAESPRFIETVPRQGYRFIASVEAARGADGVHAIPTPRSKKRLPWTLIASLSAAALAVVLFAFNAGKLRTRIFAGVRSPGIHSLAVLPLENLSNDPAQDYFSEGFTDALITDLAQITSLRVISRTSSMQFKGSKESLPQIGRDLSVDAIIEGTVTRSENRVRITAQLIEASSDRHLWAKSYERDLKDVLALQDEVARDISEEIRIKLTPRERTLLTEAHVVGPEAHDDYLRGLYWWSKRTAEGEWKGLDYFQKAVAKEPNYALAYAGIADSYIVLGHHGRLLPKDAFPKAKEAALKAINLDSSLAEAHTSLAIVELAHDRDWEGAESEFKQAIALNPNYATAHHWYSHYLLPLGRLDEAIGELERARDLDPFSTPINEFLGITLYCARRYDDALLQVRRTLEMHPELSEPHDQAADIYEQQNKLAEAFAERQQALRVTGEAPQADAMDQAYRQSGYEGYLRARIHSLEQTSKPHSVPNLTLAHLYARLEDQAHALRCLEQAYDEGDPWLVNARVDPGMDPVRASPRFKELMHRLGLPP